MMLVRNSRNGDAAACMTKPIEFGMVWYGMVWYDLGVVITSRNRRSIDKKVGSCDVGKIFAVEMNLKFNLII